MGSLLLRPRAALVHARPRFTPTRWTAPRYISSSPSTRQEKPQTATTPEVAAASPSPSPNDVAARALDDLFAGPSSSTSSSSSSSPSSSSFLAQSDLDTTRPFGADFSRPSPRGRSRPRRLEFEDMVMPDGFTDPSLANKGHAAASLAAAQAAALESYPRLNPTYGRAVELDNARGRDIVRGIGMLGSLMARNKIKADFNKQRFHERGGLKRKRLNSERWRARFRKGFQEVTGRVIELTKKGW